LGALPPRAGEDVVLIEGGGGVPATPFPRKAGEAARRADGGNLAESPHLAPPRSPCYVRAMHRHSTPAIARLDRDNRGSNNRARPAWAGG